MGFFNRAATHQPRPAQVFLDSGRRLCSTRTLTDCLASFEDMLLSYRLPQSSYRSAYVVPGWRWNNPQEKPPETVISFADSTDNMLFAAFWPGPSSTECGLFPLGVGNDRLSSLPIIGHWKQRDSSLTSIGVLPGRQLSLIAPPLPEKFVGEILTTAGFPPTQANIEIIGSMISSMFLVKSQEFISSHDRRTADRFVQSHQYDGGTFEAYCQNILNDLVSWNSGVIPYIQDLPMRVRAIVLEASHVPGSLWEQLEQLPQPFISSQDAMPPSDSNNTYKKPEAAVEADTVHGQIESQAEDYFSQSYVLIKSERYEEALAICKQALQLDPAYAKIYALKGYALGKLEQYEEALIAYDRALALEPSWASALGEKGRVLSMLGRYQEALDAYTLALFFDPHDADMWTNRGDVLTHLGRYQEALDDHNFALSYNPNDAFVLVSKGHVLYHLGRYQEALGAYDQALSLGSMDITAWINKGLALSKLGRYQEALTSFDRVLALDPNNAYAQQNRSVILRALGRP